MTVGLALQDRALMTVGLRLCYHCRLAPRYYESIAITLGFDQKCLLTTSCVLALQTHSGIPFTLCVRDNTVVSVVSYWLDGRIASRTHE